MKLDELSEEIITHIISFLPPEEIKKTKFVSSLFYKLSNDNLLWEKQLKKYFPHHYRSLKDDKSVQHKTMFGAVMKHDYRLAKMISAVRYKYIRFSKEEIDIFNYAKTGNLNLFSEIFKSYAASPDKLKYLLHLCDRTQRSFIYWAGYFGNQKILDITFKEISKFFSYDNSSNYDKELFGIKYLNFSAMCNQINIFQGVPDKESQIINDEGFNILKFAISCCHTNLIQYLINERGLDITQTIEVLEMNKSIYYAAAYGNSEVLQHVLFGSKITRDDIKYMCEVSIQYHNSVALEYLLSQSFSTNVPHESNGIMISSLKDSALKTSVGSQRFLLIIMLLKDQNCNANCALADRIYRNIYMSIPEINFTLAERLFHSVKNHYLNKNGLYDIFKKDEFGNTIFHWLAYCNQIEILSSLSKQLGNNSNSAQHTPIELAAICGHTKVVNIYLKADFNINDQYYYDRTLLSIACEHGHEDLVRFLISFAKIDVNLMSGYHRTPLLEACERGYQNIVSILLDAGADVNIADFLGVTPLIIAAENGYAEILRILLDRSEINTDMKILDEKTALDCAKENGHKECILLLQAHNNSQNLLVK